QRSHERRTDVRQRQRHRPRLRPAAAWSGHHPRRLGRCCRLLRQRGLRMNPREAAELLGHCAMFDGRKPSQGAAVAWASALHDIPLDADAKAAVAAYYSTPPKDPDAKLWILPHHVRTLRSKIRSQRLENFQYEP